MNPWPPHQFRTAASVEGVDEQVAQHALEQARRVQATGLPAILTLKHLAVMTGVRYGVLRQIAERTFPKPYRFFDVRKRSGGYRKICVPHPSLLRAQKWIARYILRDTDG